MACECIPANEYACLGIPLQLRQHLSNNWIVGLESPPRRTWCRVENRQISTNYDGTGEETEYQDCAAALAAALNGVVVAEASTEEICAVTKQMGDDKAGSGLGRARADAREVLEGKVEILDRDFVFQHVGIQP